jgi:adenosylcobinamide kinase/adenosylcobinamide-phosphate guanylyltransferase
MSLDSESDEIRRRHHRFTLVLGGARSGKSRYAETLLRSQSPPWIYVATAEPLDAEMQARIAEHRRRRDDRWQTIEAPRDLAGALRGVPPEASVLIDCLTLWLANLVIGESDLETETQRLQEALAQMRGAVVAVANEVGCGIVPENALARRFRDAAGQLNQRLAAVAERVVLVVAGLPMDLK